MLTKPVLIHMETEVWEKIKAIAAERGISASALARMWLKDYYEKYSKKKK